MEIFTMMNRKKGYNQVAYVRRSTDPVDPLLIGGRDGPVRIKTVTVTTKSGDKYEMPVDGNGRVPKEYIYARFLDESSGSKTGRPRSVAVDLATDARRVFDYPEKGFTPKELIETGWWQYPNESDIYGVDDTSMAGSLALMLEKAGRGVQESGKRIVLMMPEESAKRVWRILRDDFTASELKRAVKDGGLVIREGNPGKGAGGYYAGRFESSSVKTPLIVLGPNWDEDTLVHEFTHHLRQTDSMRGGVVRTPFRLNEKGERKSYYAGQESEYNSARNLEEAATVAEAATRTREPCGWPTGYYEHTPAHGNTWKERYAYDRELLAGDRPRKGRAAEKRVSSKFEDTSISHLRYYFPGSNAESYYKRRKSDGTLPIASKPARKTRSKPGSVPASVRPVAASANVRRYRRYRHRDPDPKTISGLRAFLPFIRPAIFMTAIFLACSFPIPRPSASGGSPP